MANGTIVDQGGPGLPGGPTELRQVPTLLWWAMLLMALGMMGAAFAVRRRE